MKIGFRLTLLMIALNLFSAGTVGVTLLVRARYNISDLAERYTITMAEESAAELASHLENYWFTVETIAKAMEQYPSIMPENRRNMLGVILESVVKGNEEIVGMWCVWEPDVLEGNDQAHLGSHGTNAAGRFAPYYTWDGAAIMLEILDDYDDPGIDYYRLTIQNNFTTLFDPYTDTVGTREVVITTIATPIRHDNKIVGAVGVDIYLETINKIAQTNKPYDDAVTALFSNNGTIVSHFDPSRIGKNMQQTEQDMAGSYMNTFVSAIKEGKVFNFKNHIAALNVDLELYSIPIRPGGTKTPWAYAVGVLKKTVMVQVYDMIYITIIISAIIFAVVVCAAVFLSRSITKPIIKVAENLKDISEGEGDLTRTIPEKGNDELTDLSHYFNLTLGKIKSLIVNIKGEVVSLSGIGNELAGNMDQTASAVNEITANVQSIKGRVIGQSASVTETNATMEQITVNISRLNSHVERQALSVTQSSSAIEEMLANIQSVTDTLVKNARNVKELMEASEVGHTGLQEVAADIQEIANESEGLLEINSVMENIASQTNLLSMNAAIEAAHAGEAGKGFAVVADEIRKLAENSGEQSKTISAVLKKIKASIDKITHSTDNVLQKFEAIDGGVKTVADQEGNIRNAMEEQGQGSKQILQAISEVNESTHQVKDESEKMLDGSKEVIQESKNLERVTQEITGGMNEMAAGANQINAAVNRVNELCGTNRRNIDALVKEVSKFKVE
ncbi:MAG: methyl-accepting chemotaxis protein [Treponema sp.]|jgi:methyl-accepting chemotaxis protein|nr:methyl-accepting chemotaxis protein [Treponema sp.]